MTLCVGKDLTVSEDGGGDVQPGVLVADQQGCRQDAGQDRRGWHCYTFHYTVVAEQTGISDAGWTLSGQDHDHATRTTGKTSR